MTAIGIDWANAEDASVLLDLLCTARQEIGLADHVCDEAYRAQYLDWMRGQCEKNRILIATSAFKEIIGVLVFDGIQVFSYVVVSARHRGKGIGPYLVSSFIASDNYPELRAEARNAWSRRMLEKCSFVHEDDYNGDFPVLVWHPNPR
jgi:GNAT superfamily N-acetyltransferase